jgi:hypothetical protein
MKKYKTRLGDVKGVSHGALSSRLLKRVRERERAAALITFSKQPAPHISLFTTLARDIKGGHVFEIFHIYSKKR